MTTKLGNEYNDYPILVRKRLPYSAVCRQCGANGAVYVFTHVYYDEDRPVYNYHKKHCSTACYKTDNKENEQ